MISRVVIILLIHVFELIINFVFNVKILIIRTTLLLIVKLILNILIISLKIIVVNVILSNNSKINIKTLTNFVNANLNKFLNICFLSLIVKRAFFDVVI